MDNKKIQEIKDKYKKLETEIQDPAVLGNQKKYVEISREFSKLKEIVDAIDKLEKSEMEIKANKKILQEDNDQELKDMAQEELKKNKSLITDYSLLITNFLKPKNPLDKKSVIMEIRAGTGGDESALFTAEMFRMYSHYAEKQNWKVKILSSNQIGIGGFKEIIFEVNGAGAYGNLKFESGVHRVQRVPETEKAGRVHTSAVSVAVLPEADEVDIKIEPQDLKIDVYRSSGPGGQSVNTTDSAVRVTHIPTGVVVSCQDEKSQHKNRAKALSVLRSRILADQEEKKQKELSDERKSQIGTGDRSEKIRTYNFPQDRITDHRIKKTWHNLPGVMDGDVDQIIEELKRVE